MPVLYLSELLALAFGASPEQIGLKYHRHKLAP
jgi:heterodisulfide reductase subunit B